MLDTAPHVQTFLTRVDRVSDRLKLNVPQIVEIEKLRLLPLGSFGRAWADTLDRQQLAPLTSGPRRKQLHDGIHLLTGYGTDLLGEAEVQAFLLGTRFRLVNLLLGVGLLRIIHRQLLRQGDYETEREMLWRRLWQAYQRGKNSCFDPDRWQPETLWDAPLQDVRTMFLV